MPEKGKGTNQCPLKKGESHAIGERIIISLAFHLMGQKCSKLGEGKKAKLGEGSGDGGRRMSDGGGDSEG